MTEQKVLIFGMGGVGAIVALNLQLYANVEITCVVRSGYEHIAENGYQISSLTYGKHEKFSPKHLVKSVDDARKHGPFHFLVVSTKNIPEISKIENLIASAVSPETVIVLIQNGFHIELPLLKRFPENIILSGVSQMGSESKNGIVNHYGGVDRLSIGYFENDKLLAQRQELAANTFVSLYQNEHNECLYVSDVKHNRWKKLVYNSTLNTICTLAGVDIGRLEIFGGADTLVVPAMQEIISIAKADGVDLPQSLIEDMLRIDDGKYYKPSMLVDFEKGNYMEIENILGAPLKIANEKNVPVPVLTVLYNLLKVHQKRLAESKGYFKLPTNRPSGDYRVEFEGDM